MLSRREFCILLALKELARVRHQWILPIRCDKVAKGTPSIPLELVVGILDKRVMRPHHGIPLPFT